MVQKIPTDRVLDHFMSSPPLRTFTGPPYPPPTNAQREALAQNTSQMTKKMSKLQKRIVGLEDDVAALTLALNESRIEIQALRDYCFTDKGKWQEGINKQS